MAGGSSKKHPSSKAKKKPDGAIKSVGKNVGGIYWGAAKVLVGWDANPNWEPKSKLYRKKRKGTARRSTRR